jgi:site-specific DNA recombinase
MSKRAAGYTRVSTLEQAEADEVSLGEQEQAIRDWCTANGYELTEIFSDPGRSGTNGDRPGFKSLLAGAARGDFDLVVVWKSSRLFRSGLLAYRVKESLTAGKCDIRSVTDGLNLQTLGFYALVGEMERDNLISQMVMGKLGAARKGIWTGGQMPFGYRVDEDGRIREDPNESPILRRAFAMLADGWSLYSIVKKFESLGIKTRRGANWQIKTLRDMLKYSAYTTGKLRVLKRLTDEAGQPPLYIDTPVLIDRAVWDQAHRMRQKPPAVAKNHRGTEGMASKCLLRGRLFCGCGCGSIITALWRKSVHTLATGEVREYRYLYYISYAQLDKRRSQCSNRRRIRALQLDDAVWNKLLDALNDREVLRDYVMTYAAKSSDERNALTAELRGLQRHESDLSRQRDNLRAAILDKQSPIHALYTPDQLRTDAQLLADQLRQTEREIERVQIALSALPTEEPERFLDDIHRALQNALEDEACVQDGFDLLDDETDDLDFSWAEIARSDFDVVDLSPEFLLASVAGDIAEDVHEARRALIERLDIRGVVDADGTVRLSGVVPLGDFFVRKGGILNSLDQTSKTFSGLEMPPVFML